MQVINWKQFEPIGDDILTAMDKLSGIVNISILLREIVKGVLQSYPWSGRDDLIRMFDPSKKYSKGDWVAFPQIDDQQLRPDTWLLGQVTSIKRGENPKQDAFQVVAINLDGQHRFYAANILKGLPYSISFPPREGDLDWLVSDVEKKYHASLRKAVEEWLAKNKTKTLILGDQVLVEEVDAKLGIEHPHRIKSMFERCSTNKPYLTLSEILKKLQKKGCLVGLSDEIASFILSATLSKMGYHDLGNDCWVTDYMLQKIDRFVKPRMNVPVIRSKVAQKQGEDESRKANDEIELKTDPEASVGEIIKKKNAAEKETAKYNKWQPPSTPIQLPTLTYLHIIEGYFPLGGELTKAFDPNVDPGLVRIKVIDGEPLEFLVNWEDGILKAVDQEGFRHKIYLEHGIPAGTKLWLEYQKAFFYRLFPRPLPEPKPIKCKIANLINGRLVVEEIDGYPMRFESDPYLFKSELRFEDIDALFAEAEKSDMSIADAIWYTFKEQAEKNPDVRLHHTEVFNAVFFQHRMCSPRSVAAELYNRPCFVPVGNGCFMFEPNRGIQISKKQNDKKRKSEDLKKKDQKEMVDSGYFILQERLNSAMLDRLGKIYDWKQGVLDSNQIVEGARFIHYLPGEKMFFGDGKIERIDSYEENGDVYFNGYISDYEFWDPGLPLTKKLGEKLSFIEPEKQLWIDHAKIRKIQKQDYDLIIEAYNNIRVDSQEDSKTRSMKELTVSEIDFWKQIKHLIGETFQTLGTGARFSVIGVDDQAVNILLESSKYEHSITRYELENTWDVLIQRESLDQQAIRSELGHPNPTYISSILRNLPGVTHKTSPIRLYYKPTLLSKDKPISSFEYTSTGQSHFLPEPPLFAHQNSAEKKESERGDVGWLEQEGKVVPPMNGESHTMDSFGEEDALETQDAFETLIAELKRVLEEVQMEGAQAFRASNFADAETAAQQAKAIKMHIETLKKMEENWGSILVGVLPNDTKKNNTKRTHLSPGVKTPNEAYRIPILKSLIKLGGSAKARDVLEIVEIEMRDRLKAVDYELLSSGRARWKSSASWERSTMKDEGLINPESPHGTWEITDKGRSFLEKNVQ